MKIWIEQAVKEMNCLTNEINITERNTGKE